MRDIVDAIGNFIFVEHTPEKADVIIAVGGSIHRLQKKQQSFTKMALQNM